MSCDLGSASESVLSISTFRRMVRGARRGHAQINVAASQHSFGAGEYICRRYMPIRKTKVLCGAPDGCQSASQVTSPHDLSNACDDLKARIHFLYCRDNVRAICCNFVVQPVDICMDGIRLSEE